MMYRTGARDQDTSIQMAHDEHGLLHSHVNEQMTFKNKKYAALVCRPGQGGVHAKALITASHRLSL